MQTHDHLVFVPGVVLVASVMGPIHGLRVRLELVLVRVGRRLVDWRGAVGFGTVVIVGRLRIGCVCWFHVVVTFQNLNL